nr:MAG TPA: hypothetical protein [Caudoviricetes sp.]
MQIITIICLVHYVEIYLQIIILYILIKQIISDKELNRNLI